MFPFRFLQRRQTEALFDSMAQEIATAARLNVRDRVEDLCQGMSVHEMRGYVRARAAQPIRSRAAQRLQSVASLSPVDHKLIVRRATERVVQLVVRDLAGLDLCTVAHRKAA